MGRQEGGVLGGGGRSREKGAGGEGKGVSRLILGECGLLLGRDGGGVPGKGETDKRGQVQPSREGEELSDRKG